MLSHPSLFVGTNFLVAKWQRSFSNADLSVVGVKFMEGKGQSQKRFSNFLAPPAEKQGRFSNAELSVVRHSSVHLSVCQD